MVFCKSGVAGGLLVLHAGDKQRRTAEGYTAARPIVVGSALRRIVGRIPCAQLKFEFAKIFAEVRALGSAIPAGIEIAYRTVTLATDAMIELADDAEDLPVPLPSQPCHCSEGTGTEYYVVSSLPE